MQWLLAMKWYRGLITESTAGCHGSFRIVGVSNAGHQSMIASVLQNKPQLAGGYVYIEPFNDGMLDV